MKRLPAIPTVYRGIKFRSKLEAKYARAFDILGISWTYEEVNFMFDDGTCYAPDFYMPDMDTYFEVKGVMTDEDNHKISLLANQGKRVVVGGPNGTMLLYDGVQAEKLPKGDWKRSYTAILSKCTECGKHFFLNEELSWECTCCGAYDGDHYLALYEDNLFDHAFGQ